LWQATESAIAAAGESHGATRASATGRGVRTKLLAMSASTIDRQLHLVRERARGGRKRSSTTNRVRKLVAVRTFADWEQPLRPGFMEMDLVTHSGPRAEGSFVHTLVLTDVASGWTECVALPVREQSLIVEAITGPAPQVTFLSAGAGYGQRQCLHERYAVQLLPGARHRVHPQSGVSQERTAPSSAS